MAGGKKRGPLKKEAPANRAPANRNIASRFITGRALWSQTLLSQTLLSVVYLALLGGLFAFLIADRRVWRLALGALFPSERELLYPRASLPALFGEHIILVVVSSAAAALVGTALGIFVTRPAGRDFRPVVSDLSSFAQTIPPVAVLALAVPFIGFGLKPALLALFLFSVLPVLRNTVAGLESVPAHLLEAAVGMGMTRGQALRRVELPLSLRVIMAGIRTSVVINVGTATVGAIAGAGGFGSPIVAGLVRENPAFVLEGAVSAALLAFFLDQLLARVERGGLRRGAR
jgi:osmoprotectant transport system permease protein